MYQPEKLKARRKELKLTQKEIAEELGISFQAYSAWERGIKEPSKEKVAQLEKILKVVKGYFTHFDTVYFNEELAHDFASWVAGDSMEPKYQNGSVALIRETGFDYDGAVYAVVCNNQTYIKRVYREEDGLRLVSINPKYKDIFISYEEDPRIVGIIVGNFVPMEG